MKFDYKDLLKKGIKELPESVKSTGERFEIPKVKGHLEGNKTIIINFFQIADTLNREYSHMLKFLQRELAAPAKIEGQRLILGRKIPASLVNDKIRSYANIFVICPSCNKPDTKLVKEGKVLFLKCMACGAKQPIKAKI